MENFLLQRKTWFNHETDRSKYPANWKSADQSCKPESPAAIAQSGRRIRQEAEVSHCRKNDRLLPVWGSELDQRWLHQVAVYVEGLPLQAHLPGATVVPLTFWHYIGGLSEVHDCWTKEDLWASGRLLRHFHQSHSTEFRAGLLRGICRWTMVEPIHGHTLARQVSQKWLLFAVCHFGKKTSFNVQCLPAFFIRIFKNILAKIMHRILELGHLEDF